jgi:hypothetical protein
MNADMGLLRRLSPASFFCFLESFFFSSYLTADLEPVTLAICAWERTWERILSSFLSDFSLSFYLCLAPELSMKSRAAEVAAAIAKATD